MEKLQVESWFGKMRQLLEITWRKRQKPLLSTLRPPFGPAQGMLRLDPELSFKAVEGSRGGEGLDNLF
jgi:hypothetical protein